MEAPKCSKCGAQIVWLRTPKGKWMPADAGLRRYRKNPKGKSTVVNSWGEMIRCDLDVDDEPDGLARVPHWATCPNAGDFRKSKKGIPLKE